MPLTVLVAVLPALSVQLAVADRLAPSPVTTSSAGWATGPDSASVHDQLTVTSPVCQPSAKEAVSTGLALSTLMPVALALALLPAASVAVPEADWLAPSPRTLSAVLLATPDSASVASKLTVTSSSYQPAVLGARSACAVMLGPVLSMLTTAVLVAELPALSVAVPTTCWSLPSAGLVTGAVQLATPEPWSAHSNVTFTSWLV